MNIDEVLLNETEYSDAYMKAVQGKLNTASILRITEGHDAQKKAQALKLLEWLKEPCIHGLDKIIGGYRDIGDNRITMNCLECMTEIEKLLKEG